MKSSCSLYTRIRRVQLTSLPTSQPSQTHQEDLLSGSEMKLHFLFSGNHHILPASTLTTEPYAFEVRWSGPREITEFDRYQVAIGIRRKTPQIVDRGATLKARFTENLKPGRTYQVTILSLVNDNACPSVVFQYFSQMKKV